MKTLDMELFAKRLKEARQNKGFKQKALSELTGISVAMLSAYENPNAKAGKNPTLSTAYTLANALDVSIDWLCGNELLLVDKQNDSKQFLAMILEWIASGRWARFFEYKIENDKIYSRFDVVIPKESDLYEFIKEAMGLRRIIERELLSPDNIANVKRSIVDKYKDIQLNSWEIRGYSKAGESNGDDQTEE